MAMHYFACKRAQRDGEDFEAWPSLLFEPANLVAQVFGEATSMCGRFFKVVVVQGDAKSHGGNHRLAEASTLGKDLDKLMVQWSSKKSEFLVSSSVLDMSMAFTHDRLTSFCVHCQ
jgi:hypothetical protein